MQEVRTILAYIDGMTAEIGDKKGLTPTQWGKVKAKLERIAEILDEAPQPAVVAAAVAPAAAAAPPPPKALTQKEWIERWRAHAKRIGGYADDQLDEMAEEIRGYYGEHKDPEVNCQDYFDYMARM